MEYSLPDLSDFDSSASTAAGEWLLSDHPWAMMERIRRRATAAGAALGRELGLVAVEACLAGRVPNSDEERKRMRRLRKLGDELKVTIAAEEAVAGADVDDDEAARRRWEQLRREAGETDYVYPAHLVGLSAAEVDPPDYMPQPPRPSERFVIGEPVEYLTPFERWRVAFIKAGVEAGVQDARVKVTEVGGYLPVQVIGTIDGHRWAYHHRHGRAWMGWGGRDPFNIPEYEAQVPAEDTGPYPGTEVETVDLIIRVWFVWWMQQLFPAGATETGRQSED